MPRQLTVHWNPPQAMVRFNGKTRCGRVLSQYYWTTEVAQVDCGNCQRGIKADWRKGKL